MSQGERHLARVAARLRRREGAVLLQHGEEVAAAHVLHAEEDGVAVDVRAAVLHDEQVRRVAGERAIVLVSRAADRPANAIAECGVNWLNWGPFSNSLIIYRHMLPRGDFAQAIQRIPGPAGDHEREVMGEYYPYGTHLSKAAFEALGCPVDPDAIPQAVTDPTR